MSKDSLEKRGFKKFKCYMKDGELVDSFRKEEKIMKKDWSPDQLIGFDNAIDYQIFTMLINRHLFWWGCFAKGIKIGEELVRTAVKS